MSWCVNRWHGATIGRHSLSQPFGLPAPSEREPGNVPMQRAARKPQRCGRFSSPLRNSNDGSLFHSTRRPETARLRAIFIAPTKLKIFYIPPFNERHSLSQPLRAASSLREGAGWGAYHSTCRSETATLRAIFIAPTKTRKPFPFAIQPGTR